MKKYLFTLFLVFFSSNAYAQDDLKSVFNAKDISSMSLDQIKDDLVKNKMVCNKVTTAMYQQGMLTVRCMIEDTEFEYTFLSKKEYTLAEFESGAVVKVISQ